MLSNVLMMTDHEGSTLLHDAAANIGNDPGTPVWGSAWGPEPSRERVGDWGGPETVWALLRVAERRATRPNGEWR